MKTLFASALLAFIGVSSAFAQYWQTDPNGATMSGNAGIGTAAHPLFKLLMSGPTGSAPGPGFLSLAPTGYGGVWSMRLDPSWDLHFDRWSSVAPVAWAEGVTFNRNGNVGIGTSILTGTTRLEVVGTAITYGPARRVARFFDDSPFAAGVGAGLDFLGKYNSAGGWTQYANIKGVKVNATDGNYSGAFVVSVDNNLGSLVEVLRVTEPNGTADNFVVTGNANFTGTVTGGNIKAHYQDVAEWVSALGDYEPGTVVVISPAHRNTVMAATTPYDSSVAGVVSAQPGITLGEQSESKALIAAAGRVKVKVDATKAPIRAGDLLVTSGVTGVAMRSEPLNVGGVKIHQPGTVIGKALEPLASGKGEILVLLSLQ